MKRLRSFAECVAGVVSQTIETFLDAHVWMIWTCTMQSDSPGGGAEAKTLNTQHRMGVNMPSQARSPRSPHWGVTMTMAMMAYLGSTTTRRNRKKSNGGGLICHMLFLMSIKRSNRTLSSSMIQHFSDDKMVPSQYSKHQISSRIKCSSSFSSCILPGGLEPTGWLSRFITRWNIVMDRRGKTWGFPQLVLWSRNQILVEPWCRLESNVHLFMLLLDTFPI